MTANDGKWLLTTANSKTINQKASGYPRSRLLCYHLAYQAIISYGDSKQHFG